MNDVLSGVKHLLETRATPDNAHQTKNMHIFHTLHPTKRAKEKKPYSGPFLNAILRGGISQVVSATFRNHLQTDWNSLTANQKPLFQWFYGKLHEKIARKGLLFLCTNLFESLGYLEGCAGHITEGTSFDLFFFVIGATQNSFTRFRATHKVNLQQYIKSEFGLFWVPDVLWRSDSDCEGQAKCPW